MLPIRNIQSCGAPPPRSVFALVKSLAGKELSAALANAAAAWPAGCFLRYHMNGLRNANAVMRAAQVVMAVSACALIAVANASTGAAEPQVVVNVASGRQFTGELDRSSNREQLVLRSDEAGITLWRPIHWQRVISATADGKPTPVDELRNLAIRQGTGDREQGTRGRSLLRKIELRGAAPTDEAAEKEAPPAPQQRVTMLAFDASIANWDADVETDGVLIDVAPLDINRRVVAVPATVEVELFAPQRRTLDLAPQSGGDTLELVERWTRAITPDDFGPSGVRLRLPFGAITPELQPNWTAWHYGLVHVRLSAPGHGVFDDSRDGIRIRPWAPNRDRLEMKTGQRFLSTEYMNRRD